MVFGLHARQAAPLLVTTGLLGWLHWLAEQCVCVPAQDTLLMRKLLDRLSATKTNCKHAVNAVNAAQQTPLCLVSEQVQHSTAQFLAD